VGAAIMVDNIFVGAISNAKTLNGHAELRALQLRNVHRASRIDIVLVRVTKEPRKPIGLAKPCAACLPRLQKHGVDGVYYTTDCGKLVYESVRDMKTQHRCLAERIKFNGY
jgi:pyrimidine deaminase RibD-like protein